MLDPKNEILGKVILIYACVLLFGIAVFVKIILIQVRDKDELLEEYHKQSIRIDNVVPIRGNIFSKNGTLLATTVSFFDVYFDAKSPVDSVFDKGVRGLADSLSMLLRDKSSAQYLKMLKKCRKGEVKGYRYYPICKRMSLLDFRRMQKFPIFSKGRFGGGFIVEDTIGRVWPYRMLARRTVGSIVKINDSVTQYVGIEGAYDDYLKGVPGKQMKRLMMAPGSTKNNTKLEFVPVPYIGNVPAENGKDLYTSIDVEIQDVAEKALKDCLKSCDALSGCVVMMDVKTGFVEVIANLEYKKSINDYYETRNIALLNIEPGSTFKAATMAALLENNPSLNVNKKKLNIGENKVKAFYGKQLHDSHVIGEKGVATVRECFEQSSNIAFAMMADDAFKDKPTEFIDYLKSTICMPLELDIKGTQSPYLNDPRVNKNQKHTWSKLSVPWIAYGQEVLLPPINVLMFYNAIANDGVMVKPQFVKEIRSGNEVIKKFETVVLNDSIASPKTIATMQSLLRGVVENGTAKRLNKCAFPIAGKTGTAQIKGSSKSHYSASFVGYFPADEPKYSCIVVVANPRGKHYYGADVALPVFEEIAKKVYATRLGIVEEKSDYMANCSIYSTASMSYYDDAVKYCEVMDINFNEDYLNSEWAKVENKSDRAYIKAVEVNDNEVPDLTNMNITDAVYLIESLGWKAVFNGYGRVKKQSVEPGTQLEKGKTINLSLKVR